MCSSIFLYTLLAVQFVVFTNAQRDNFFFRKDYTYLRNTESFYKIHTLPETWQEAKKRCEWEGAHLFHPEDEDEAHDVIAFWNQTHNFYQIYVGLNALLAKGVFLTVDGRTTHDVYINWRSGEPNNGGGSGRENCVEMFADGTFNDIPCDRQYPYICKKNIIDLQWNKECNFPRTDYIFNGTLDRCYKFHSVPRDWTEAMIVCHSEQSHLAVINSQAEFDFLMQLATENYNNTYIAHGLRLRSPNHILLGIHNRLGEGWKTIKGDDLETSGYSVWAPNKPSGYGPCGGVVFQKEDDDSVGQLTDFPCEIVSFFVCEHEISSQSLNHTEESTHGYDELLEVHRQ
ncbi:lectin c-type domain-containing protein [Phthorimaea operculella]|nr:lectin c-type domain-containing protein [Phthorimaea operculella]